MTHKELEMYETLVDASQEFGRLRLAFARDDDRRDYCIAAQDRCRRVLSKHSDAYWKARER